MIDAQAQMLNQANDIAGQSGGDSHIKRVSSSFDRMARDMAKIVRKLGARDADQEINRGMRLITKFSEKMRDFASDSVSALQGVRNSLVDIFDRDREMSNFQWRTRLTLERTNEHIDEINENMDDAFGRNRILETRRWERETERSLRDVQEAAEDMAEPMNQMYEQITDNSFQDAVQSLATIGTMGALGDIWGGTGESQTSVIELGDEMRKQLKLTDSEWKAMFDDGMDAVRDMNKEYGWGTFSANEYFEAMNGLVGIGVRSKQALMDLTPQLMTFERALVDFTAEDYKVFVRIYEEWGEDGILLNERLGDAMVVLEGKYKITGVEIAGTLEEFHPKLLSWADGDMKEYERLAKQFMAIQTLATENYIDADGLLSNLSDLRSMSPANDEYQEWAKTFALVGMNVTDVQDRLRNGDFAGIAIEMLTGIGQALKDGNLDDDQKAWLKENLSLDSATLTEISNNYTKFGDQMSGIQSDIEGSAGAIDNVIKNERMSWIERAKNWLTTTEMYQKIQGWLIDLDITPQGVIATLLTMQAIAKLAKPLGKVFGLFTKPLGKGLSFLFEKSGLKNLFSKIPGVGKLFNRNNTTGAGQGLGNTAILGKLDIIIGLLRRIAGGAIVDGPDRRNTQNTRQQPRLDGPDPNQRRLDPPRDTPDQRRLPGPTNDPYRRTTVIGDGTTILDADHQQSRPRRDVTPQPDLIDGPNRQPVMSNPRQPIYLDGPTVDVMPEDTTQNNRRRKPRLRDRMRANARLTNMINFSDAGMDYNESVGTKGHKRRSVKAAFKGMWSRSQRMGISADGNSLASQMRNADPEMRRQAGFDMDRGVDDGARTNTRNTRRAGGKGKIGKLLSGGGKLLKGAGKGLGTGAKMLGKGALKAAKFIPGIGLIAGGVDAAISGAMGYQNTAANFDLKEGEKATGGQKAASTIGGIASGLTFGLLDEKTVAQWTHKTGSKIKEGLGNAWSATKEKAGEAWEGTKQWASDAWSNVSTTWSTGKENLKQWWGETKGKASEAWESAKTKASEAWTSVSEKWSAGKENLKLWWGETKQKAGEAWDSAKTKAGETWTSISETWSLGKENLKLWWGETKQKAGEAWDSAKTKAGETWTSISETWSVGKENLKLWWDETKQKGAEAWDTAKTKASETWTSVSETWSAGKENLKLWWGEVKGKAGDAWDRAKTGASDAWATASEKWSAGKENLKTWFGEVKTKGGELWSDIKTKAAGAASDAKTAFSNWASDSKTALGGLATKIGDIATKAWDAAAAMGDAIKKGASKAWENIKSGASTVASNIGLGGGKDYFGAGKVTGVGGGQDVIGSGAPSKPAKMARLSGVGGGTGPFKAASEYGIAQKDAMGGTWRKTSNYGYRSDPFDGSTAMHRGVDYAAPAGTPIGSSRDGTVVYAGLGRSGTGYGGYGNVAAVQDSSGLIHLYAHMSKVDVANGQVVKAGQKLGEVGNTGRSKGNHLHYEVRKGGYGSDINPMPYVNDNIFSPSGAAAPGTNEGAESGIDMLSAAKDILSANEGSYTSVVKSDNGHGVSIGKLQWHENRAKDLLQRARKADRHTFDSVMTTTAGGRSVINKMGWSSWDELVFSQGEADAVKNLFKEPSMQKVQDQLIDSDITGYLNKGKSFGLQNEKAIVYFADLYNQSPKRAGQIASTAVKNGGTLDAIHNAALAEPVMGKYKTRRNTTYDKLKNMTVSGSAGTSGAEEQYSVADNSAYYEELKAGVSNGFLDLGEVSGTGSQMSIFRTDSASESHDSGMEGVGGGADVMGAGAVTVNRAQRTSVINHQLSNLKRYTGSTQQDLDDAEMMREVNNKIVAEKVREVTPTASDNTDIVDVIKWLAFRLEGKLDEVSKQTDENTDWINKYKKSKGGNPFGNFS